MVELNAALRGGITHIAISRQEASPVEPPPAAILPHPAVEPPPESSGLDMPPPDLPPNLPLYRRLGRRILRVVRPLVVPFLVRLQGRVTAGVDASLSAQSLQQMLSMQAAIDARLNTIAGTIETMAGVIGTLARTVEQTHALASSTATLVAGLPQTAEQTHALASSTAALVAGLPQTVEQTHVLASSMAALVAGLPQTVEQTHALASSTATLVEGLPQTIHVSVSPMVTALDGLARTLDETHVVAAVAAEYSSKLLQVRAIPLGNEVLARSPFGWLLLSAKDLPLISIVLETGGVLEPGTATVLQALLEQGDLAIDVGANVGTLTLAMARSVAPGGRVLAIEPTPESAGLLRRTSALAGLGQVIQIEECAVGAEEGTAKLAIGITSGHNSLLPLDGATDSIEVRVRPLDALLAAGSRPALVKIDAEGFELEVWRGMTRLLQETPDVAVVIEFGPSHLLRSGVTIEAWLGALTAPGFTPWEIDEASGTIRPLRTSGLQDVFSMNLLLLRHAPSHWPRLRIAT